MAVLEVEAGRRHLTGDVVPVHPMASVAVPVAAEPAQESARLEVDDAEAPARRHGGEQALVEGGGPRDVMIDVSEIDDRAARRRQPGLALARRDDRDVVEARARRRRANRLEPPLVELAGEDVAAGPHPPRDLHRQPSVSRADVRDGRARLDAKRLDQAVDLAPSHEPREVEAAPGREGSDGGERERRQKQRQRPGAA